MLPQRIKRDTPADNFLAYVEERGGCWQWDGSVKQSGYGQHCYGGRKWQAHRFAYLLFRGEIPTGMSVCHACDNRGCVNPDHLWLGTQTDNMRDMVAKGRRRGPSGEGATWAILNEALVREILASAETGRALARRMGVSPSTIYAVRKGRTWKAVSDAAA